MNRIVLPLTLLFAVALSSSVDAQLFRRCCKPRCTPVCLTPSVHTYCPQATNVASPQSTLAYTSHSSCSSCSATQVQIAYNGLGDYGRWCGANNTSAPHVAPIDGVDAVCKAHDLCINRHGHKCSCDAAFLRGMASASASSEHGEAYRVAAIGVFLSKPCYCTFNYPCGCSCNWRGCSCRTCQGRYGGRGGQCGPR